MKSWKKYFGILVFGLLALLLIAVLPSMFHRPHQPANVDARAGEALRFALVDLLTIASDTNAENSSVDAIINNANNQGRLDRLRAFGLSNCLFNPRSELWKSQGTPTQTDLAIALRRDGGYFFAIRFDYSLLVTNDQFETWIPFQ